MEMWKGFQLERDWVLQTQSGRRVLVMEADCSPRYGCLSVEEMGANDLDHYEVTQGFHSVTSLAAEQGVLELGVDENSEVGDMTLRVMLCNQAVEMVMGGRTTYPFRDYMRYADDADVIIDALQPVLAELLQFANSAWERCEHPAERQKTLVFDTIDADTFDTMQEEMGKRGWKVIDRPKLHTKLAHTDVPWIVYHNSTPNTINTIRSVLSAQNKDRSVTVLTR